MGAEVSCSATALVRSRPGPHLLERRVVVAEGGSSGQRAACRDSAGCRGSQPDPHCPPRWSALQTVVS